LSVDVEVVVVVDLDGDGDVDVSDLACTNVRSNSCRWFGDGHFPSADRPRPDARYERGIQLLEGVVAMLTKMV
jgi:hypothetical protein